MLKTEKEDIGKSIQNIAVLIGGSSIVIYSFISIVLQIFLGIDTPPVSSTFASFILGVISGFLLDFHTHANNKT